MNKNIRASELSLIIDALLNNASAVGELESSSSYLAFVRQIGMAVAEHCGGEVLNVYSHEVRGDSGAEAHSETWLVVAPNDSLPDIEHNIWSAFDPQGWADANVVRQPVQSSAVGSLFSPTDKEIIGTLDSVPGVSYIQNYRVSRLPDGAFGFQHDGETDLLWNDQRTMGDIALTGPRCGHIDRIFVDEDQQFWRESQLRFVPSLAPLFSFDVSYRDPDVGLMEVFRCQAEDADHAQDQCLNAHPDVMVFSVARTDSE